MPIAKTIGPIRAQRPDAPDHKKRRRGSQSKARIPARGGVYNESMNKRAGVRNAAMATQAASPKSFTKVSPARGGVYNESMSKRAGVRNAAMATQVASPKRASGYQCP